MLERVPDDLDFADLGSHETDSVPGDIKQQLKRLKAAGFKHAIAVNLSKADLEIPVVKVVVPHASLSRDGGFDMLNQRVKDYLVSHIHQQIDALSHA